MTTKQRAGTRRFALVSFVVALNVAGTTAGCSDEPALVSCGNDSTPLGVPADLVWGVSEPCVTNGDDITCPESATFVWSADQGARRLATGNPQSQSPDGTWIATSSNDGRWSVASAIDGTRLTIPGEPVAWSADSRRVVTVTFATQRLTAIDLASGTTLRTFPAGYSEYGALSPDGNWFAMLIERATRNADGIPQPGDTPDVVQFAKLDGTETRDVPLLDPVTGTVLPFPFLSQWTSDSAYAVVNGLGGRWGLLVGLEDGGLVSLARDPLSPQSNSASHTIASPVRPEVAVVRSNGAIDLRRADGSSNRELVAPGTLSPRLRHFSADGALLSYETQLPPGIRVVDVGTGTDVASGTTIDITFDGWIVTDGRRFSRVSAASEIVHEAPTREWSWMSNDRYAYIARRILHVANVDGSADEPVWEASTCSDDPDTLIHIVRQRGRLGW